MLNSTTFDLRFDYQGKPYLYRANKMHISYAEVKDFYRIEAKTGNRDLHKVGSSWRICGGAALPPDLIIVLGKAIECAEEKGFSYNKDYWDRKSRA